MTSPALKPSSKQVQAYYESLKAYAAQGISHETAVRSAFQNLLAEAGKAHKWTLVPELTMKVKGKSIRPDATLRDDEWHYPRGYWEAKDTDASLDKISGKVAKGHRPSNKISGRRASDAVAVTRVLNKSESEI